MKYIYSKNQTNAQCMKDKREEGWLWQFIYIVFSHTHSTGRIKVDIGAVS